MSREPATAAASATARGQRPRTRAAPSTAAPAITPPSAHCSAAPDLKPAISRCHSSAPSDASAARPSSRATHCGTSARETGFAALTRRAASGAVRTTSTASMMAAAAPRLTTAAHPVVRRGAAPLSALLHLPLAQLDAADLAGQRLRQVLDELDPAGVRVGRQPRAHVRLDVGHELVRGRVPLGEHDERLHDVAAPLV